MGVPPRRVRNPSDHLWQRGGLLVALSIPPVPDVDGLSTAGYVPIDRKERHADRGPPSYLSLTILPGLYEWIFIHPELAEHLP